MTASIEESSHISYPVPIGRDAPRDDHMGNEEQAAEE